MDRNSMHTGGISTEFAVLVNGCGYAVDYHQCNTGGGSFACERAGGSGAQGTVSAYGRDVFSVMGARPPFRVHIAECRHGQDIENIRWTGSSLSWNCRDREAERQRQADEQARRQQADDARRQAEQYARDERARIEAQQTQQRRYQEESERVQREHAELARRQYAAIRRAEQEKCLERLRFLFRLAKDLHYLDFHRYEFAARAVDESGRLDEGGAGGRGGARVNCACPRIAECPMKTETLIDEAAALPVEERARLAESLLASLNATDAQIDAAWAEVAHARLAELRAGKVTGVAGDAVFARIRDRLSK